MHCMASLGSIQIPWCQNYSSISSSTLPAIWLLENKCWSSSCWSWRAPGKGRVNIKCWAGTGSWEQVYPACGCDPWSSSGAEVSSSWRHGPGPRLSRNSLLASEGIFTAPVAVKIRLPASFSPILKPINNTPVETEPCVTRRPEKGPLPSIC